MRPSQTELLESARLVLSGEKTYTQLRECDRFTQVYVFIAVMLVCHEEYLKDSPYLRPREPFYKALATFVHGDESLGAALVKKSRDLGTHRNSPALGVVLTPQAELQVLVRRFSAGSPGVMTFYTDMKDAKAAYLEQLGRLDEQAKAERAALRPVETAGNVLIAEIFGGNEDNGILAKRILWDLYGPAAKEAAAKIAAAPPEVQAYVSTALVDAANRRDLPYTY